MFCAASRQLAGEKQREPSAEAFPPVEGAGSIGALNTLAKAYEQTRA